MKNHHLSILTLSAVSVSATADVNKSHFPTGAYINLGGLAAAADDATDAIPLQEDSSGIVADCVDDGIDELVREVIQENPPEERGVRPEWKEQVGWHRKEDMYSTQDNNEGVVDKTGKDEELLNAQLSKLKAKAKIQADKEEELRELLAEEMKEKEVLKAKLAELESKESWFDTSGISINSVVGVLATAGQVAWGLKNLNSLYKAVAPSATPTTTTNNICNTVVNKFVDPSTAKPICDTLSYAVDLVKVKVEDEVIDLN